MVVVAAVVEVAVAVAGVAVVVVVVVLRRTWQAAWEVELRGRLLRRFFCFFVFTFGCFVEARRPLLEKVQAPTLFEHFDPRNLRGSRNATLVNMRGNAHTFQKCR